MTTAYERRKERERKRRRTNRARCAILRPSQSGQTQERSRWAVKKSLREFCERVLTRALQKEVSPDHLKAIAKIQRAVIDGDVFALAMPLGPARRRCTSPPCSGPSSMGIVVTFVLIGSDRDAAAKLLAGIKSSSK